MSRPGWSQAVRQVPMNATEEQPLAGIEYGGEPGLSIECQDAIMRLLQTNVRITHARILSSQDGMYCFLLTIGDSSYIAIKSGFRAGYEGLGPLTFSYVLQLLDAHGVKIEEFKVASDLIERLDDSALTRSDIENLESTAPLEPPQWHNYLLEVHLEQKRNGTLWREFPAILPYKMIDSRLVDLALSFWENRRENMSIGCERLEEIVRHRTGLRERGAKLFTMAFIGPPAKLEWKEVRGRELAGRVALFTGVFDAYHNRRAHQEWFRDYMDEANEFLILNGLYRLEKTAVETGA